MDIKDPDRCWTHPSGRGPTCARGQTVTQRTCSVEGCAKPYVARGWCRMHYKRWWTTGVDPAEPAVILTDADRLWAQVDRCQPGCWEWTGGRHPNGYGRIRINGKETSTHRLSWRLTYGPFPDELDVLHHCDNPPCVRPDHLFLGTDRDNSDDKMSKGRSNTTHSGRAKKLTWEIVEAMRVELDAGASRASVAKAYGVSTAMASLIARRISWDPNKRLYEDREHVA